MGWGGIKYGKLLDLAAQQFDVFVTADKNLPYQQNLNTLPLSVVVLDAPSNEISHLLPLIPKLEGMLVNLTPCSYAKVVT